jgi:hypothetical protein
MAATGTVIKKYSLGRTGQLIIGTVLMDSSYPTGGEAVTFTDVEYIHALLPFPTAGYVGEWDKANGKLKVYRGDNDNAADAPLVEVANAVDLSAVTFTFLAVTG